MVKENPFTARRVELVNTVQFHFMLIYTPALPS